MMLLTIAADVLRSGFESMLETAVLEAFFMFRACCWLKPGIPKLFATIFALFGSDYRGKQQNQLI